MQLHSLFIPLLGLLAIAGAAPIQERAENQERTLLNMIAKKYNADTIESRSAEPAAENEERALLNMIAKKYNADIIEDRSNEERALLNMIAKKYNADLIEE